MRSNKKGRVPWNIKARGPITRQLVLFADGQVHGVHVRNSCRHTRARSGNCNGARSGVRRRTA
jgi:hypothetical protein